MERGVIQLTSAQMSLVRQLMEDAGQPSALMQKFLSTNEHDQISIQLSEDEVETILDLLPMPASDEPNSLTTVRTQFLDFLSLLRFGKPK